MACPFLQNVQPEAVPSACPFGKGASSEPPPSSTGATCPLGFGSAGAALPSPLHCSQCRGLFHDCVRVEACGHKFCRYCISPFNSFGCPVCGVDVDTLKPDHETNGLVDKFLDIHAGNPSLWTKMAGVPPSQDTSKASFLLLLGMQSYAGGNVAAALSRLQACKQELMLQAASRGEASTDSSLAAASIKAGAVCGTLADCYKQMAQRAPPTPHPPASPQQQLPKQQAAPHKEPDARTEKQQGTDAGAAPPRGCPFHHAAGAAAEPVGTPPAAAAAAAAVAPDAQAATSASADGQAATTSDPSCPARPAGGTARQVAAAGCPHVQQQQQQQQQQQRGAEAGAGCGQSCSGREEAGEEPGGQLEETGEQLLDHAAELYREGIELLGTHVGTDPEAVHALAVTHNKLGDLQYVRQAALDAAGGALGGPEGEALALDVAVSSIKVADASKALGDSSAVDKFCSKARQLLLSVQAGQAASGAAAGPATAKCQQLMQLLDAGLSAS